MVGNIRRVNSNASEQSYALLAWVVVLSRYTDIVTQNRIGWPWLPEMFRRQADMSLAEMLSNLPTHCAVGTKRNAKGR
jgi:hypothetical protein